MTTTRSRPPAATQSTTRLEFFTDGVFAIAATLLVLDLTASSLGTISSNSDLWAALARDWPLFFNFALSFLLLCLLWMIHTQQFRYIARVDGTMTWLNNFRLLFIVLVPFSTSLTTEYSDFYAGRMAMPVTFFFALLFGWLQWRWAVRYREQMLPDLSEYQARHLGRNSLSAVLIGAVVVALSPFIGSFGFTLFILDGLITKLIGGIQGPDADEETPAR